MSHIILFVFLLCLDYFVTLVFIKRTNLASKDNPGCLTNHPYIYNVDKLARWTKRIERRS